MKNKKIIIIISILVVIAIGIASIIFLRSNNDGNSINNVKTYMENNEYEKAYNFIDEKDLLSKADKDINDLIKTELNKYKVTSLEDYLKLSDEDWQNINSFEDMLKKLKLDSKYDYVSKLIEINENYQEYIPAIKWKNSDDYEVFRSYMKVETQDDFEKSGLMMKNYSFEKYGLDNKYIKELNEEVEKYIDYCMQITKAINAGDVKAYDSISSNFKENIANLSSIEVDIVLKTNEVEEAIKDLPNV